MSDPNTKIKSSRRRARTQTASRRQYAIAKNNGMNPDPEKMHRYAKHHAMDCGRPGCMLCGNPRKIFKEKTIQERKFDQGCLPENDN